MVTTAKNSALNIPRLDLSGGLIQALRPLEVIRQGPLEIPPDIRALVNGALQRPEIPGQEVDPQRIVYGAVQKDPVRTGQTVFTDHQRQTVALR